MPYTDPEKEREYMRQYRAKNKEKINRRDREWKRANYHRFKDRNAEYRRKTRLRRQELAKKYRDDGRAKFAQLKSRYGVTRDEIEQMLLSQGGNCAVCDLPLPNGHFWVDHDHETNSVRGLVHMQCNTLMGLAKDDPIILERAAQYLRKFKERMMK